MSTVFGSTYSMSNSLSLNEEYQIKRIMMNTLSDACELQIQKLNLKKKKVSNIKYLIFIKKITE
jgi:hypothetical protein